VIWQESWRASPRARVLADRHYNRQKIGAVGFVPPGRCLVLYAETDGGGRAFWVTSWPFAEYVRHRWPGAWVCSAFRNEGAGLSSDLITQAVAATVWRYGAAPPLGMVTFVNAEKTRRKRDPGRCFRRAGFVPDGETEGGLIALRLRPDAMPVPEMPHGAQASMIAMMGPTHAAVLL